MDLSLFQPLVPSSQAPWLPEAAIQYWGRHAAWGLVLGSFAFLLGARYNLKWRGWAAIGIAVWSLWPGLGTPSYWLGLAFQSPSLMSVVLCVIWAVRSSQGKLAPVLGVAAKKSHFTLLTSAGIFLGWVLLGDTLAWWSVSVYAWGFSTLALAMVCVPVLSLWYVSGRDHNIRALALAFSMVLFLYVLTRLPSGNLWDAILDPWLWFILQVMGLQVLIRRGLHLLRA